ncbi:hypothetical protein LCGC14_1453840, partial [marine sediment metagenome]
SINLIHNYSFLSYSTEFQFKNIDNCCLEKVIRTGGMCPRYFYDLYDTEGNFSARGITRAFSWVLIDKRKPKIDIYDYQDNFIGMIESKFQKDFNLQFNFYNAQHHLAAIAYINKEMQEIIIVSPDDPNQIFSKFTGQSGFEEDVFLNISFTSECCPIDNRIIKIFASLLADFYDNFIHTTELSDAKLEMFSSIMQIITTILGVGDDS